jgi:hypothetical protein
LADKRKLILTWERKTLAVELWQPGDHDTPGPLHLASSYIVTARQSLETLALLGVAIFRDLGVDRTY